MGMTAVTESNFETFITSADVVLVDIWAAWCQPCVILGKRLESLAAKYRIGKVNADECPALVERLKISAMPTLLYYKAGKLAKTVVGIQKEKEIETVFAELAK